MNEPVSNYESREALPGDGAPLDDAPLDDAPLDETPPQFGVVDIVEAFTAMRHEWRSQTKESRGLAEKIQTAVSSLHSLESILLARTNDTQPEKSSYAKPLALLLAETDHQLTRAIAALSQWEANRRLRETADAQAVERYFAGMSALSRWFARPLLMFIAGQRPVQDSMHQDPAVEGLNLVLARLRRELNAQGIERLDSRRQVFDADTMYAIGTVAAPDCPSGHVAEQLSPAYRWRGEILRFADVRIAE